MNILLRRSRRGWCRREGDRKWERSWRVWGCECSGLGRCAGMGVVCHYCSHPCRDRWRARYDVHTLGGG